MIDESTLVNSKQRHDREVYAYQDRQIRNNREDWWKYRREIDRLDKRLNDLDRTAMVLWVCMGILAVALGVVLCK